MVPCPGVLKTSTAPCSRLTAVATIGSPTGDKDLIEKNRKAVIRNYSLKHYRQTLLTIYARVGKTMIRQRIDKRALLAEFFDLTKFSLLKWGDYGL